LGHSVKVGDVIVFGNKNWSNSWRVLAVEDTRVLLITERVVDTMVFNGLPRGDSQRPLDVHAFYADKSVDSKPVRTDNLWDKSDMKKFLNNDYYINEFNDHDKALIHDYGFGKVFLLSSEEAKEYFYGVNDRAADFTGSSTTWWLRSSITYGYTEYVACVDSYGRVVDEFDDRVGINTASRVGVRPAVWLKIK
nr:DUF6273 domain-containing protein [Lachnospiraceae bacterium]